MPLNASQEACRPSELAHFVLRSKNPQKLIEFYQNFLNAKVNHSSDLITFMTWDHEHHRFAIINDPNAIPKQDIDTVGVDHFALTYDSLEHLLQAYKTRKEVGIEPAYCVNHGMSTSMYYKDPDGNKIENQVDVFKTKEEAVQYMTTNVDFTKDPRGPRFDPEELLRRFEAGEDEKSLMKRESLVPMAMKTN